jgi:hypothetical protein
MGIVHKYQLIFVSIPRTGSQSVASILSNACDSFHSLHEHLTYFELLLSMDENHFYSYKSFTIVRNPYTRFESMYYEYIKRNTMVSLNEFVKILLNYYSISIFNHRTPRYLMPQSYFCVSNGQILVDTILKFEELNSDWTDFIKNNINECYHSSVLELPHINSSIKFENMSYTPDLIKIINKLYYDDFVNFGYDFQ